MSSVLLLVGQWMPISFHGLVGHNTVWYPACRALGKLQMSNDTNFTFSWIQTSETMTKTPTRYTHTARARLPPLKMQ